MSKYNKKVALIGGGMIARIHMEALRVLNGVEILGVYDANPASAERFAESYRIPCFFTEESVWDSDADLVCICTPSGTHAALAVKAMKSGKHVLVEKPLALTFEDCRRILDTEAETGKLCAPVSQLRMSDSVRMVKAAIDEGKLGKLTLCNVSMKYYRDSDYYNNGWRGTFAMDGGGALMNQGIHGIDLLRWFAGEVRSVSGKVATLVHDIEVEDTAAASVVFKNGALGSIVGATSVNPGYPRRIELCGDRGSIIMEEDSVIGADIEGGLPRGDRTANGFRDPAALSSEGHRRQLENVFAAIDGKEQLFYTARDAAETVRLITAIYRSSAENRAIEL